MAETEAGTGAGTEAETEAEMEDAEEDAVLNGHPHLNATGSAVVTTNPEMEGVIEKEALIVLGLQTKGAAKKMREVLRLTTEKLGTSEIVKVEATARISSLPLCSIRRIYRSHQNIYVGEKSQA